MMSEAREDYILLLLGAGERSIPTPEHLQKEMFLLCEAFPKAKELFQFEKHYEGPYSQSLQEQAENPFHRSDAYGFDSSRRLQLTESGRRQFNALLQKNHSNDRVVKLLQNMKLIRDVYDRLTRDEILLLIYVTYPKYTEFSEVYEKLVGDPVVRKALADGLLVKGVITEDRYKEIIAKMA